MLDALTHADVLTAIATAIATVATGVIAWFTVVLSGVGRQQIKDTRILQRAYVGVKPLGIDILTSGDLIGQIAIVNRGNLPARELRAETMIAWDLSGNRTGFVEIKLIDPPVILLPKDEMLRGTGALPAGQKRYLFSEDGYVYVWGRVEYDDGFDSKRWLIFCHTYPCARHNDDGTIDAKFGRLHRHHNDGN